MPGPWVTMEELLPDVRARLAIAQVAATPEQWGVLLSGGAVLRGWQRILQLLSSKGLSPAAIDQWSGRQQYNRDYAMAYAFRHGAFAAAFDQQAIDKELKALDDELSKSSWFFDDAGLSLTPDPTLVGGAKTGRIEAYDVDLTASEKW